MTQERASLGDHIVRALELMASAQLVSGEIPAYRRGRSGSLEYCWMPLISAYVHDALAVFDLRSMWFDPQACEIGGTKNRLQLSRIAADVRRGIRGFLAWQQSSSGGWSRYGRDSGEPSDADATSCAAAALLDSPHRSTHARLPWYHGAAGSSPPEALVARWNWFRYRSLTAADIPSPSRDWFLPANESCQPYTGGPVFYFALARALRDGRSAQLAEAASVAIPALLALRRDDGLFGGTLNTALAILALTDLGYGGDALETSTSALRGEMHSSGLWPFEVFLSPACGSPSLSTAFAIAALARAGHGLQGT